MHRRAIMGLYALSSECRTLAQKARTEKDDSAFKLWKDRLSDLGLKVANELVEMGELETAQRHLDTLSSATTADDISATDKMCIRKTLLWLKIGDTQAAKKCLATSSTADESTNLQRQVLEALVHFSASDFSSAVSALQALAEKYPSNPLIKHNLAIAYLYNNNVVLASETLEALVTEDEVLFPTLLFNLSTVYELRTERARQRKLELVDKAVEVGSNNSSEMQVGGFDKGMGEFKLA